MPARGAVLGGVPCGLAGKISDDFHDIISDACSRCKTGSGGCVIELMFEAVEEFHLESSSSRGWTAHRRTGHG